MRTQVPDDRLPRRAGIRGYNLVEVMIAAGLLAAVLLSIVTLFILGGQRIRAGRLMTKATASGMDVMEEFRQFPREWTWKIINGKCASPCDTTKTWRTNETTLGIDPGNSSGWATENLPPDDFKTVLRRWKTDVEEAFRGGKGFSSTGVTEIRVDGFNNVPNDTTTGNTCFCDARYLRVRVTIRWRETSGRGNRQVTFETLRF